jgi:hypothetical protein
MSKIFILMRLCWLVSPVSLAIVVVVVILVWENKGRLYRY